MLIIQFYFYTLSTWDKYVCLANLPQYFIILVITKYRNYLKNFSRYTFFSTFIF